MILFLIISTLLVLASLGFLLFKNKDMNKKYTLCLLLFAPALVVFIYLKIGTPEILMNAQNQVQDSTTELNQLQPEQINQAIEKLNENLHNNPEDINSLNLLSNSYLVVKQYKNAISPLEKLISLGQSDSETLLKTINSYSLSEQGKLNERAHQLLEQLMQQSPNHPEGLWLAGIASIQKEQIAQAKIYWNQLIPILENTPQQQELINIVEQLEKNYPPLSQQDQKQDQINTKKPPITGPAIIIVNISISKSIDQNNIKDSDLVFVFALAKNGPPAPLAVKRLTVADLPTTITLTEQDAILPQMTISTFDDIVLSAKISKTGDPSNKEGDINSQKVAVKMSQIENQYELNIE